MSADDKESKLQRGRNGQDYEVGYGKPPKHTRFQPGQSGNPKGGRKGIRNLLTDVKRTLRKPVKVKDGGRVRNVSTQEGALMRLRESALKGDARALDRLLELAGRFNNDPVEAEDLQPLAASDQAILDAFANEINGSRETPPEFSAQEDAPSSIVAGRRTEPEK